MPLCNPVQRYLIANHPANEEPVLGRSGVAAPVGGKGRRRGALGLINHSPRRPGRSTSDALGPGLEAEQASGKSPADVTSERPLSGVSLPIHDLRINWR